MKNINEIINHINETSPYGKDIIHHQVKRIIEKFDYEVTKGDLLNEQDAEDVEFIVSRFLSERYRKDNEAKTSTNLMPIVKRLTTDTKPMPRLAAMKMFRRH